MRRKQYIDWLSGVFGIFGTVYGGSLLLWHYKRGNGLNIFALVLLIVGSVSLLFFIALLISRYITVKKMKNQPISTKVEEDDFEDFEEEEFEEEEEQPKPKQKPVSERSYYSERSSSSYSSSSYSSTIYVKLVGYGPVLRISGSQILDMRNNTYYRIEGNMVHQEGSGPRFEIRGNQIRDAFGGYLFELSGNNINKIYDGFYASISGSYITLYDSSSKYEMTGSLSANQILAVAVLLFKE